MSTDYLSKRRHGDDKFNGFKMFRVQRDAEGIIFADGMRYALFDSGRLVGEYSTESGAMTAWLNGTPPTTVRLSDYKGIDEKLRGL